MLPVFVNPVRGTSLKMYPKGELMQLYGANPHLYGGRGHNGIDIIPRISRDCLAAHNGVVQSAESIGPRNPYGLFVTVLSPIDAKGYQYLTLYGHLQSSRVVEGQAVEAGQELGIVGNSGFVYSGNVKYWNNAPTDKGVHLHLNVYVFIHGVLQPGRLGGAESDPLPYLLHTMPFPVILRDGEQFIQTNTGAELHIFGEEELHTLMSLGVIDGTPDASKVILNPTIVIKSNPEVYK